MKIFVVVCLIALFKVSVTVSQHTKDSAALIKRQVYDLNPDGTYIYAFETENQIFVEEQAHLNAKGILVKQGQFQYTAPDGQIVRLRYTADENGFHPQGSHLPVAP